MICLKEQKNGFKKKLLKLKRRQFLVLFILRVSKNEVSF